MFSLSRDADDRFEDTFDSAVATAVPAGARPATSHRPHVDGKFFFLGDEKLYLRGVTYGTFRASTPGDDGYDPLVVDRDFAAMTANGINALRLYSAPPRWLLDSASQHGLWVMAGIPWTQHVTFLDSRSTRLQIEDTIRRGVRSLGGHPALLGVVVGNEVPASIVRWHGATKIERFLDQLCDLAHEADPGALVTYATYPSTEYLELAQVDFAAYNVYIENGERYAAYMDHLQTLAGDLPLVLAETGLDSRRHGEEAQARLLELQISAAFARGAAGTFVFAWTDDWSRSGVDVLDWEFGLTTRDRRPKPSLSAVKRAFARPLVPDSEDSPRISVVVCSYNGENTIDRCLRALTELAYPEFEVIVIDDGSTDRTAAIASGYDVRLVRTANHGLSAARNEGLRVATGEIIAFIDDDAWPDRDWLGYLAATYRTSAHVGVGGPNIPPRDQGKSEQRVARAPGGPIHVLRTDTEAEHIPGCNCSFRVDALREIGGFDPTFRVAGDDVDVCWRIHERGWTLGFAPGAVVWHRRRASIKAYLRQQRGYGAAEALLERKWPSRFNALGHISWPDQLYGRAETASSPIARPFHGTWGLAEFQSLYSRASIGRAFPLVPEWLLVLPVLVAAGLLGIVWHPLLVAWPLLAVALGMTARAAISSARHAARLRHSWGRTFGVRDTSVLAVLYVAQSVARLSGRLERGLTPWRRDGERIYVLPAPLRLRSWSEDWQSLDARLRAVERRLSDAGVAYTRGGPFDRWELEIRTGSLASSRILATAEEHGSGTQLLRFRVWPRISAWTVAGLGVLASLAGAAWLQGAAHVSLLLLIIGVGVGLRGLADAAMAMANARAALAP